MTVRKHFVKNNFWPTSPTICNRTKVWLPSIDVNEHRGSAWTMKPWLPTLTKLSKLTLNSMAGSLKEGAAQGNWQQDTHRMAPSFSALLKSVFRIENGLVYNEWLVAYSGLVTARQRIPAKAHLFRIDDYLYILVFRKVKFRQPVFVAVLQLVANSVTVCSTAHI